MAYSQLCVYYFKVKMTFTFKKYIWKIIIMSKGKLNFEETSPQ